MTITATTAIIPIGDKDDDAQLTCVVFLFDGFVLFLFDVICVVLMKEENEEEDEEKQQ